MKKILVLFGIIISMSVYSQEKNALCVQLQDGTTETYALVKKPVISLSEENMLIAINENIKLDIKRSEIAHFYFDFIEHIGIEAVNKENVTFQFSDGENVTVYGLTRGTLVSVSSIDGKNLYSKKCRENGVVHLSLANLPKGIYLLSYGKRAIKIRR